MYDVGEFRGVQGRAVQEMPQKKTQSAWVDSVPESAQRDRRQTERAQESPQLLLAEVRPQQEPRE